MKLKEIIVYICSAISLTFIACSNEEHIDKAGSATNAKVTFFTQTSITKAATTPGRSDELTINNCVVAFFPVADGEPQGTCAGLYQGTATKDDTNKYKAEFEVNLTAGKSYQIFIVANPQKENGYSKSMTYDDFKAFTEELPAGEVIFNPTALVKTGQSQIISITKETTTLNIENVMLRQLAARIDVSFENAPNSSYSVTQYRMSNINVSSSLLLANTFDSYENYSYNATTNLTSQQTPVAVTAQDNNTFSFYTYERKVTTETPIDIIVEGELSKQNGGTTPTKYKLSLNPVTLATTLTEQGVVHGHVYKITGKVTETGIDWNYNVIEWKAKETDVIIDSWAYLKVKDTDIAMPNLEEYVTKFESSSPIHITNFKLIDERSEELSMEAITYTADSKSGDIIISAPIPSNFVPRKFSFTVNNEDNLKETVTVVQYPPLYIEVLEGEEGVPQDQQNNWDIYTFTSLIADYSDKGKVMMPDDFYDYKKDPVNNHFKENEEYTLEARKNRGSRFYEFITQEANMGYPKVDDAICTIASDGNNKLISPKFMLASQKGITSASVYDNAKTHGQGNDKSCKDYVQTVGGKSYDDWRLPTKAELYLIDILQNVKKCAVKKILEGDGYWAATPVDYIQFIDPRLYNQSANRFAAWRCVRDIK